MKINTEAITDVVTETCKWIWLKKGSVHYGVRMDRKYYLSDKDKLCVYERKVDNIDILDDHAENKSHFYELLRSWFQ